MSKYTMRNSIEFIVHLYDNKFGILACDLTYIAHVFYAEYLLLLSQGLYKSHPVRTTSCLSRTNSIAGIQHHQQKLSNKDGVLEKKCWLSVRVI